MPYACMISGKVVRISLEVSVEVVPVAGGPAGTILKCVENALAG
jgi:hypothetical protein